MNGKEGSVVQRGVALAAVALVAVGLAVLLLRGGDPYRVKLRLLNASQLVEGNLVQVSGNQVGEVEKITLADDGQAEVVATIHDDYAPLHRGTVATVRQASLSGIANRYVDLAVGPDTAPEIENGAVVPTDQTRSAVDVDQLYNIFDAETRKNLSRTLKGFADMYAGRTDQANEALRYLNPNLAASARLFAELNRNSSHLERFVTETSSLVGHLAERRDDLSGVVSNLATTSSALAAQKEPLGEAIDRLPGFLRKSNTTFVNLRATLDDLDPLVAESRPVVRRLRPLFDRLRPFARDAAPTVRDLSRTIRRPGDRNDLIELLRAQPAVARVGVGPVEVRGQRRRGAFAESTEALRDSVPNLAYLRPYAVDLTAWFDDFSTSGGYDAIGGFSRAGLALASFTFSPLLGRLVPVPPQMRPEVLFGNASVGRNNRCPGSSEREPADESTTWVPTPDFNCDPEQRPIGR